jgi:esterase/lipase superfamily enzyme
LHKTLLLLLAFGLASCAATPENLFAPAAQTAPGASRVDMLVATTRRAAADPAELYSSERGGSLSFANVVVSIPPDSVRAVGEVQWPSVPPGNPATDFVVTKASRLDFKATRSWLDSHGSAERRHRVLIFVHGYNNRFGDAVFRFAQLVHDSDAEVSPILFTWPSRGSLFAYGYDRESAGLSRDAHVNVFDLTDIKSSDATNHSKFVQSPELVRLVGDRWASGQTLTDGRVSVVDQFLATTANEVGALETSVENVETAGVGSAAPK